ncbi:MAG: Polysaccharide pyruvyl transferase [Anaerocolumna sp.]|jgi:hypothetical protein|nr:Polysaccharide pyruvyl transferase [Anaerocolumna sp.]
MKIGILTHHYVKNFGAYMQAYGLIAVIKAMYPKAEIEIIDYRVLKHEMVNTLHFFGYKPKRGDTLRGLIEKIGLFFTLRKYEHKLPTSKRMHTAADINSQRYNLIIVGSDEVWNFNDIAYSPIKFGKGITAPMITYAASAGGSTISDVIPAEVKLGVKKFASIAVRDEGTEEFVIALVGRDTLRTLDPVYLYDYRVTCRTKIKNQMKKPYILIYDCHLKPDQVQSIKEFTKKNKLSIVGAGEYRYWYDFHTGNITPFEWAYLFKNSWGVITGTFHGTSFAIKYNRRVAVYLTEKNRINKVGSLLKELHMTSQIVSMDNEGDLLKVLSKDIDYEQVNTILKMRVDESSTYLQKGIEQYGDG